MAKEFVVENSLIELRMELVEFAQDHTFSELLTRALDVVCNLVESSIGFYHFVSEDQQNLSLQQWSTATLQSYCLAKGVGMHYPVSQAGIWADAVRLKKAVMHNDYSKEKNKKGLPQGHAVLNRELVVPVLRNGLVVAILGVGNKESFYTQKDQEIVSYFADITWGLVDRQQSRSAMREAQEQYELIFKEMIDGYALHEIIFDEEGIPVDYRFIDINPAFEHIVGLDRSIIGKTVYEILPDTEKTWIQRYGEIVLSGKASHFEDYAQELDKYFDVTAFRVKKNQFVTIIVDVTEKIKLKDQLIQAQKMEALGLLAGGVAHDFNNILAAIFGYGDILLGELVENSPALESVHSIVNAAERAKHLVNQILSFSRRGDSSRNPVHIKPIVEETAQLLKASFPATLTILSEFTDSTWPVLANTTELHEIVMNLGSNAVKAMSASGILTLKCGEEVLLESKEGLVGTSRPGCYSFISIKDTGTGIDPSILNKIFVPFFTTGSEAESSGMGLSVVYGIVSKWEGNIFIDSIMGKGTCFKIILPEVKQEVEKTIEKEEKLIEGKESIMIVDDEEALRRVLVRSFSLYGYNVVAYSNGSEALAAIKENPSAFDLIVSDQTMPVMTGMEMSRKIRESKIDIPIIICSGLGSNGIEIDVKAFKVTAVLQKPVRIKEILNKVREILE